MSDYQSYSRHQALWEESPEILSCSSASDLNLDHSHMNEYSGLSDHTPEFLNCEVPHQETCTNTEKQFFGSCGRGLNVATFMNTGSKDSIHSATNVVDSTMSTIMSDNHDIYPAEEISHIHYRALEDDSQYCINPKLLEIPKTIPVIVEYTEDIHNPQSSFAELKVAKIAKEKPGGAKVPRVLRPCDFKKKLRQLEKPEICSKCGKGFAWRRDLDRHLNVHKMSHAILMGLRVDRIPCPYPSCTKDNKTFSRKDHLIKHIKRKHN